MVDDVGELGLHDIVKVAIGVLADVDAAPGRADDEGVGGKRGEGKEVHFVVLEEVGRFVIDLEVLFEFLNFRGIEVIDDVLLEGVAEVDRHAAHPAEGLADFANSAILKPVLQIERN